MPDHDDRSNESSGLDQLLSDDQRAQLASLPHDRLLAECLNALEDAALWHNCVQAEQAANAAWRRECDALRADAARWQHISRFGPFAMQQYDAKLGVITLQAADADRAVDSAIAQHAAQTPAVFRLAEELA